MILLFVAIVDDVLKR